MSIVKNHEFIQLYCWRIVCYCYYRCRLYYHLSYYFFDFVARRSAEPRKMQMQGFLYHSDVIIRLILFARCVLYLVTFDATALWIVGMHHLYVFLLFQVLGFVGAYLFRNWSDDFQQSCSGEAVLIQSKTVFVSPVVYLLMLSVIIVYAFWIFPVVAVLMYVIAYVGLYDGAQRANESAILCAKEVIKFGESRGYILQNLLKTKRVSI
jgi:hypothetical protein